jgi:hypothetical protein
VLRIASADGIKSLSKNIFIDTYSINAVIIKKKGK